MKLDCERKGGLAGTSCFLERATEGEWRSEIHRIRFQLIRAKYDCGIRPHYANVEAFFVYIFGHDECFTNGAKSYYPSICVLKL